MSRKIFTREYFNQKRNEQKYRIAKIIDDIISKAKCLYCPENDPRCLDFHHRDPKTKKFKIGAAVGEAVSLKLLFKELNKCDIVCANCHRKITVQLRKYRVKLVALT